MVYINEWILWGEAHRDTHMLSIGGHVLYIQCLHTYNHIQMSICVDSIRVRGRNSYFGLDLNSDKALIW